MQPKPAMRVRKGHMSILNVIHRTQYNYCGAESRSVRIG